MNEWIRRTALGAGIPVAVVAMGLIPFLAYRSDLPNRVASHYGISGRPDGSMTPEQFFIVIGGLMVLGLGGCVAIALTRRKLRPMVAPSVAFVGAFIGALCAGMLATTAIDQRGLERWQDATLSPWALIVWIGGSVIAGSVAARIASSLPFDSETGTDPPLPVMNLTPGERVFWSSTLSARWPLSSSLAVLLVALVVTQLTQLWVVLVFIAITLSAFGRNTRHRRPVGTASAIRVLGVALYIGAHTSHRHSSCHRHSPGRLGWLGIPGQPDSFETCCRGPACGSWHPCRSP